MEDRRVDLVTRELQRYNISVAALQETKWFGTVVYKVARSIVLAAGRPTPQPGQNMQRGEGVALVLTWPAVTAWRAGDEQWKAWRSRIVKATLAAGRKASDKVHVFSCYAPTFAAAREQKEAFYDDLQAAIDEVPPEERYVNFLLLNEATITNTCSKRERYTSKHGNILNPNSGIA